MNISKSVFLHANDWIHFIDANSILLENNIFLSICWSLLYTNVEVIQSMSPESFVYLLELKTPPSSYIPSLVEQLKRLKMSEDYSSFLKLNEGVIGQRAFGNLYRVMHHGEQGIYGEITELFKQPDRENLSPPSYKESHSIYKMKLYEFKKYDEITRHEDFKSRTEVFPSTPKDVKKKILPGDMAAYFKGAFIKKGGHPFIVDAVTDTAYIGRVITSYPLTFEKMESAYQTKEGGLFFGRPSDDYSKKIIGNNLGLRGYVNNFQYVVPKICIEEMSCLDLIKDKSCDLYLQELNDLNIGCSLDKKITPTKLFIINQIGINTQELGGEVRHLVDQVQNLDNHSEGFSKESIEESTGIKKKEEKEQFESELVELLNKVQYKSVLTENELNKQILHIKNF